MKTFTDKGGRQWTIDLTIGCVRRVKTAIGVDLSAPETGVDDLGKPDVTSSVTLSQRISANVMLFVDVLFASIGKQATEAGLTAEEFCELLPPEHCKKARLAFREEWEDFFRQLGRTDQLAVVQGAFDLQQEIDTQRAAATQRLGTSLTERVKADIRQATDEMIDELKKPASGTLSTNAAESLESSPTISTD